MAKRLEVHRPEAEATAGIRPDLSGEVRCGLCGKRHRRLTEVQVGRQRVLACPACVLSESQHEEWRAMAVRAVRLWHRGELDAALLEVRSFLMRTRVHKGPTEFRGNALAMQAGIQEEAGDLAAAWRSLRQRDDLRFSCQSEYLCHQIQVVGVLLRQGRDAAAQRRIRVGLKRVYEACLPDALKLLRLFCRIPPSHRERDLRRYQSLLRRAVRSFGVAEGQMPQGEFDSRVEALSVLFQEGLVRYNEMGERARWLLGQQDPAAALGLVRAFVRTEPLGFYRRLAMNQWKELGLAGEEAQM